MIYTTLNKIREHEPCNEGWKKLLTHLDKTKADDDPLPLLTILDSNGLDDCLWALRTVPEHAVLWRKYAVWCARQVEHLMIDERSRRALDVAGWHAEGKATDEELAAAREAAESAAREAARAVAMNEAAAAWAVESAAESAAREAARAVAMNEAAAAWAGVAAAESAAWVAAWEAAREAARAVAMNEAAWEAWEAWEAKMRTILSAGSGYRRERGRWMSKAYRYEVESSGEPAAGRHGFTDTVTIIVDSGDPGGEATGGDSFQAFMLQALREWFDGAGVEMAEE